MNNLPAVMAASADYEPLPRYWHISGRVGSLAVVQGGRTKDFSEKSKQHLSSVVEKAEGYAYNMHSIIFYIQCQVYAVFSPDCFDLVLCSTQRLMAHQALYYLCTPL